MKTIKTTCILLLATAFAFTACQKQAIDGSPTPDTRNYALESSSAKTGITVMPDTLHIQDIIISSRYDGVGKYSPFYGYARYKYVSEIATAFCCDQYNNYVSSVTVTGNWTGCYTMAAASGTSQVKGSGYIPAGCTSTFTVTSVSKAGYVYNAAANVVSSASRLYP
jgi:hypothetical protein